MLITTLAFLSQFFEIIASLFLLIYKKDFNQLMFLAILLKRVWAPYHVSHNHIFVSTILATTLCFLLLGNIFVVDIRDVEAIIF